jgi:hypothetical protein
VTVQGLAAIEAEYARLQRDYAAAQAEDDRTLMVHIGRDLRYFAARRASAQVIKPQGDTKRVHFGSKVTIERSDGRRQTFRIVGEDEADPAHGTLLGLVGCASVPSVHCATEGKSGEPGGCGFDMKFGTTDDPTMPGSAVSPETKPPEPPLTLKQPRN